MRGGRRAIGNGGARLGEDLDFASELVGRLFDEEIKQIGEGEAAEQDGGPVEQVAEIGNAEDAVELHALDVDEVERIAPSACSDQEAEGLAMLAVGDFFAYPEKGEDAEPDHGLCIRDAGLEMQHFGGPGSEPDEEAAAPDAESGAADADGGTLLGEEAAEEPDGEEEKSCAERAEIVPSDGMRMREGGKRSSDENNGEEFRPAKAVAQPAEERISGVVDLLAEEAPKRRFPEDRVLSPEDEMLAEKAVDGEGSGNGNENARVTAQVVAADGNFLGADERKVNAKTGDDKKDDDRGSPERDGFPAAGEKTHEGRVSVGASKERKHTVMANGHPQSEHEAQGVQNAIVMRRGVSFFVHLLNTAGDDGGHAECARSGLEAATK